MKNPITTISGVALLIFAAVSTFDVITLGELAATIDYFAVAIETLVGLIAILSGDPDRRGSGF